MKDTVLQSKIIARLAQGDAKFKDIVKACGLSPYVESEFRAVDRELQRMRRAKEIKFVSQPIGWTLLPKLPTA